MKKLIIFCMLLITPVYALGFTGSTGSGEITSSAVISAVPCYITSLVVNTDGTNTATVILYDALAVASGDKIIAEFVIPGADRQGGRPWAFPRYCSTGIYAHIAGTGASCIVEKVSR